MNRPAKYVEGAEWRTSYEGYTMFIGYKRVCRVELFDHGHYICDVIWPKVDCQNIQAESLENAMDTAEMRYLLCQ
jgi:hypothetical protein